MNIHAQHERSVLIADRSAIYRRGWAALLASRNYLWIEAQDGNEAVEKATVRKPDAVILDVRLCDHDMPGIIQAIKKVAPQTNIVLTCHPAGEREARRLLQAGADRYLFKSSHPEALLFALSWPGETKRRAPANSRRRRGRLVAFPPGPTPAGSKTMSPETIVRRLNRLELACWRGGDAYTARVLSALKIAHIVDDAEGCGPRVLGGIADAAEAVQARCLAPRVRRLVDDQTIRPESG